MDISFWGNVHLSTQKLCLTQGVKSTKGSVFRVIINGTLWSMLGVLLAITFFYWSEYRNPYDLRMSIDDEFNLVEVREKIDSLKILYQGNDILTSNREIKVLTLTLRNAGKTILQQDYDQSQPFGIAFGNASVLGAEVVQSNSSYLKDNILPPFSRKKNVVSDSSHYDAIDRIIFPKLILEEGKYVTLKAYLLQNLGGQPIQIDPLGKIANIESLLIVRLDNSKKTDTFFADKNLGVFVILYFALIALLSLGLLITDKLVKRRADHKRAILCDAFLARHKALNPSQLAIVEFYRHNWRPRFSRLIMHITKHDLVIDNRDILAPEIAYLKRNPFAWATSIPSVMAGRYHFSILPSELFSVEGQRITINPAERDFAVRFLEEVGAIEK
jgi:hypothetical protein